ncbi:MAG: ribosomal protein S18-alanine N-acetyltransferase [Desulfurococcales archaeon]|nr:ribosomal protein S18-alanine N-acetyltransferase [Desulfurococcales archaeon]
MTTEALRKEENKKPFIIRNAVEEDLPSVMMVNLKSLPENYWYGFFLGILKAWGRFFFVAEVDGVIVGYAMSRIEWTSDPVLLGLYNELEEGPLAVMDKLKKFVSRQYRVAHLISIAVLEEYRGRGIGTALLQHTIQAAREEGDIVSIYLEVRVSNTPAIRLYKKFGFKPARIIRGYYRDGEDAYVMVLKIRDPESTKGKSAFHLGIL